MQHKVPWRLALAVSALYTMLPDHTTAKYQDQHLLDQVAQSTAPTVSLYSSSGNAWRFLPVTNTNGSVDFSFFLVDSDFDIDRPKTHSHKNTSFRNTLLSFRRIRLKNPVSSPVNTHPVPCHSQNYVSRVRRFPGTNFEATNGHVSLQSL